MSDINLKYTKKKLTIIFTLLVFALAVLLEWVFFTAKYYNYVNNDTKIFNDITSTISNRFISLDDFTKAYDWGNNVFRMWQWLHSNITKQSHEEFINLIIIDRNKNELVFSNIISNLDVDLVKEALEIKIYWKVQEEDGFLIKKVHLNDKNHHYDVLFIKDMRYALNDYLTDLLGFIFITFIFSALFYYIWYRFVSKNLEPVEKNLKDMQDFIHNAWHELKTPIAIIYSNLQLIKETKSFEKDLVLEWLTEVNRLNHLIESLVELSNINSAENLEKINLWNEIKLIIKDFKGDSDKKKVKIKFNKIDDKFLTINKQYFYILFSNLLSNSIKYNNIWWKIDIILERNNLIIKDNWLGIKKENLEKIFDRFFMGRQSRNIEWHGIGLSLVKKIADIYEWKINVKSEENKGSEFIIEF